MWLHIYEDYHDDERDCLLVTESVCTVFVYCMKNLIPSAQAKQASSLVRHTSISREDFHCSRTGNSVGYDIELYLPCAISSCTKSTMSLETLSQVAGGCKL